MQYLWQSFNIKTFPANTAVFVDGIFQPDLSEYDPAVLRAESDAVFVVGRGALPVHVIFVGKNIKKAGFRMENTTENAQIFVTGKIECEKPAFLNKMIKNAGKNSTINCKFLIQNKSDLEMDVFASNLGQNTGVFDKIRVIAHAKSDTKLSAVAEIAPNTENCRSDIGFSALCAPDIRGITFKPSQRISSPPDSATHSASIWRASAPQIEYLRGAGLSAAEIDGVLREAFENEF